MAKFPLRISIRTLLASSVLAASGLVMAQDFPVGVGKPAPLLVLSGWLKGKPVEGFSKGQVYVVESWATWCQPCVESMPHLTQLQSEYTDKVQFIGVDIWEQDQKDATPFLAKMGGKVGYSIAQDKVPAGKTGFDGAFAKDWIEGAGKYSFGVPLAFVVNGDGVVAWIGHPNQLDAPLKAIVDGTWDMSAAKSSYDADMKEALRTERYKVAYYHASIDKKWADAAAACDKVIEIDPTPNANFASNEFRTWRDDAKMPDKAMAFAHEAIEGRFKDNPAILAALARSIAATKPAANSPDMALAMKAAQSAVDQTHSQDFEAMTALARVYWRKGDLANALKYQQTAIDLAKDPSDKSDMQAALDLMKKG